MTTLHHRLHRALVRGGILALLVAAIAGCSHVSPYQREYLAQRCMDERELDGMRSRFYGHVYDAREGGMTASASAGGGCGCN
jgi:hypothetical protein